VSNVQLSGGETGETFVVDQLSKISNAIKRPIARERQKKKKKNGNV